jgi:hypothetical protein
MIQGLGEAFDVIIDTVGKATRQAIQAGDANKAAALGVAGAVIAVHADTIVRAIADIHEAMEAVESVEPEIAQFAPNAGA